MKEPLIIVFAILSVLLAKGQAAKKDSVPVELNSAIGVYAGANGTYATGVGVFGNETSKQASFMYGVYGEFDINQKWAIESGFGFIQYDSKYLRLSSYQGIWGQSIQYQDNLITHLDYVTSSCILKYKVNKKIALAGGARLSGAVLVDPQGINGSRTGNSDHIVWHGSQTEETTNQFDIGLIFGCEYKFNKRLKVSLLLNAGLIPVYPKSYLNELRNSANIYNEIYIYPLKGNYNNSLSLRLCYNFMAWQRTRYVMPRSARSE